MNQNEHFKLVKVEKLNKLNVLPEIKFDMQNKVNFKLLDWEYIRNPLIYHLSL